MLTITDITRAVVELLQSKYPDYAYPGRQDMEGVEAPYFYVYIVDLGRRHVNKNFDLQTLTVKINYGQMEPDELDAMLTYEAVQELFGMTLKIEDRYVAIGDITSDYIGDNKDILQISIDISYYDNVQKCEEQELIQEVVTTYIKQ